VGAVHPGMYVDGLAVTEFRAVFHKDAAPSLVVPAGCFTFTRCYFTDGKFDLGDGAGRLVAGQKVLVARYDRQLGLRISTTDYDVDLPVGTFTATWRRA
jgi:hypothetical protein